MRCVVQELKERLTNGQLGSDATGFAKVFPPLAEEIIAEAEQNLGFRLPTTLRRIYAEVGNGGFGPAYGLLGLRGGAINEAKHDVVQLYEAYRRENPKDRHWHWPKGLLPAGHLGCGMYCCVDATNPAGPVTWFEPNAHADGTEWDDSFVLLASSTDEWLLAWLDGNDLLDKLFNQE